MNKYLFSYGFSYRNDIYFFSDNGRLYARYSVENNKIDLNPSSSNMGRNDIYIEKYVLVGEYCIGLSRDGKYLLKMNINSDSIERFEIKADESDCDNYAAVSENNGLLYVFTKKQQKIITFDLNTNRINEKRIAEQFITGIRQNENIWLLTKDGNGLIKYNIVDDSCIATELGSSIEDAVYITCVENKLYILERSGNIWSFDPKENKLVQSYKSRNNHRVGRLIITQESYIELPALGDDIYIINRYSLHTKVYNDYPVDFKYIGDRGWGKYSDSFIFDKYVVFAQRSSNYILSINTDNGEIIWKKPIIPSTKETYDYLTNRDKDSVYEGVLKLRDLINLI